MRLIDADALITKCGNWYTEEGTECGFIGILKNLIDEQPTIEERKTGRWEEIHIDVANDDKGRSYRFYVCTACGVTSIPAMLAIEKKQLKFCPNCGADMRGEKDEL